MALSNCRNAIVLPSRGGNEGSSHSTPPPFQSRRRPLCWQFHSPDQNRKWYVNLPFFGSFQVLAHYVLRMYVGKLAILSIDLFSLIHEVMGILNLRTDPGVSVVLDFLCDVALKSTSKFLQKSFVSNCSSWIFSRQNGKTHPELSPPAFC